MIKNIRTVTLVSGKEEKEVVGTSKRQERYWNKRQVKEDSETKRVVRVQS